MTVRGITRVSSEQWTSRVGRIARLSFLIRQQCWMLQYVDRRLTSAIMRAVHKFRFILRSLTLTHLTLGPSEMKIYPLFKTQLDLHQQTLRREPCQGICSRLRVGRVQKGLKRSEYRTRGLNSWIVFRLIQVHLMFQKQVKCQWYRKQAEREMSLQVLI